MAAGNPVVTLKTNFRQKGPIGNFFNHYYYNRRLVLRGKGRTIFEPDYKTVLGFLRTVTGKERLKMNTIMVSLQAREGVSGRSATNPTNVNYVMSGVHDLLSNDDFKGKIMIISPYQG